MKRPSFIQSLFGFRGKTAGLAGLALVAALNFGCHEERVEKVETDCQTIYSQLQKDGTYNYSDYKEMSKSQRLLLMATAQELVQGKSGSLTRKQKDDLLKILVAGYRGSQTPISRFEGELNALNKLVDNEWREFTGDYNQRLHSIDKRINHIKNIFDNLMHDFNTIEKREHKKEINEKTISEAPALIIWYLDLLNARIGYYQCVNPGDTAKKQDKWNELQKFLKQTEVQFENMMSRASKK